MKSILILIIPIFIINSCSVFNKNTEKTSTATSTATNTNEIVVPKKKEITDIKWIWRELNMNDGTKIVTKNDKSFITFSLDDKLGVSSDCNKGSAFYKIKGKNLDISPVLSTKMYCGKESTEKQFFESLKAASSYFTQNGKLVIQLKMDTGSMIFEKEK